MFVQGSAVFRVPRGAAVTFPGLFGLHEAGAAGAAGARGLLREAERVAYDAVQQVCLPQSRHAGELFLLCEHCLYRHLYLIPAQLKNRRN